MTAVNAPLGPFSLSLAVEDLAASRAFYEALGFEAAPATGVTIKLTPIYGITIPVFVRKGQLQAQASPEGRSVQSFLL